MTSIRQVIILRTLVLILAIAGVFSFSACKFKPHSVTIIWAPAVAGASPIKGYNVYRSTTHGGPYSRVASTVPTTVFQDKNVRSGKTYYYVITAVDESGAESPRSEELSSRVP